MLAPSKAALATYTSLILASGSPRRLELLRRLLNPVGLSFEVRVSSFAEDLPKEKYPDPTDYVMETARCKGCEVFEASSGKVLVISADTVVVDSDGAILEKPSSRADAAQTLSRLSASSHFVYTGVALFRQGRSTTFCEKTTVTFSQLTDEAIANYVDSGEPMDKAGSYGIQGVAGSFVESIDGCYYNAVGLPMNRLARELNDFLKEDDRGSD